MSIYSDLMFVFYKNPSRVPVGFPSTFALSRPQHRLEAARTLLVGNPVITASDHFQAFTSKLSTRSFPRP